MSRPSAPFFGGLAARDPSDQAPDSAREAVLDAALSAFLEYGIRRTSVAEIARRAGVSPASLYRWFGTKDNLVTGVYLRDLRRFTADLDASIDRDAPVDEQLAELAIGVARRLQSQQLLDRLIETEPDSVLQQLTVGAGPLIQLGVAYLAAFLQRFMDEGRIEVFDPMPLAEIFIRLFHSLCLTPSTALPLDDEDQLRALALEIVRALLRPPRDPTVVLGGRS